MIVIQIKRFHLKLALIILCGAFLLSVLFINREGLLSVFLESGDSVRLPVIMYHSIVYDKSLVNKYVLTADQFEADLKYIRDKGYETVLMGDLIDYVHNNGNLPEKPILLTFDDGCYNHYSIVYPMLKKYNMKAVFSIIGTFTDKFTSIREFNDSYSYMSWDQVNELAQSGIVEIQNHSYDMHSTGGKRSGVLPKKGESKEEYKLALSKDTFKLQELIWQYTGFETNTYTYPFGLYKKSSEALMKEFGFLATLSCEEGINRISGDPGCLYLLKRYNRPYGPTSAEFFKRILTSP